MANLRARNQREAIALRERAAKERVAFEQRQRGQRTGFLTPDLMATRTGLHKLSNALNLSQRKGIDLEKAVGLIKAGHEKFRGALDWNRAKYEEYVQESMERAKMMEFEGKMAQKEATLEEVKQLKIQRELQEKIKKELIANGIRGARAEMISKELTIVFRGMLEQQALSEEAYHKLLSNPKLIVEMAKTVSAQMDSKEIMWAMKKQQLNLTDMTGEITQNFLARHGYIQAE